MARMFEGQSKFSSVYLAGQSSGSGVLRIEEDRLTWIAREGSRQERVSREDLVRLEWFCGARGRQLRCLLKGGLSTRFEGFSESDFEKIDAVVKHFGLLSEGHGLQRAKQAATGWNWGDLEVKGSSLNFTSYGDHVLDLNLGEVSQVNLNGGDEVALEFHIDDTAGNNDECLVGMRFRVSDNEKAQVMLEKIKQRADTSAFTGDSLAAFPEVPVIVPRGRFQVDLFPNYFKMHGKSYDFKVLYSSVSRLFLLPKPDELHVAFVVSIDPPIRQGATNYPHIVFQFKTDEKFSVDINLSPEEVQRKYNGKLQVTETGDSWRVFSKVMKNLSGKSLHTPKTFLSAAQQRAVRTALGPNDGYLFFLESCFFFVNKPPTYIRFDDVNIVKFKRMELERLFDLQVQLNTGQTLLFSNIDRPEFAHILKFLEAKKVPLESPKQDMNKVDASLLDDGDESEDEDFDPEKKRADSDDDDDDEDDGENSVGDDLEVVPEDEDDDAGSEEEKRPKKKKKE